MPTRGAIPARPSQESRGKDPAKRTASAGVMGEPAARAAGPETYLLIDPVGDVVDRLAGLALGLAKPLAQLARSALAAALHLELRVIESFAGLFFDVALRLLGLALDLVTIHARLLRIARRCERNPTRSQGFFLQGRCQRPPSCRSATHVSVGFFEFGHFARQ